MPWYTVPFVPLCPFRHSTSAQWCDQGAQEDCPRQINNGSRIRHSFIRSPRFIPRNFHTRGRARAAAEPGTPTRRVVKTTSLVLPIQRGSGARCQRRQPNAHRHGAASKDSGTAIITAGAPALRCACLPSIGATPQEHSHASDPCPPQSFCLVIDRSLLRSVLNS
jgi:hypothetical protein